MYLLIPAAGMGKRMKVDRNKLLLNLLGKPLLAWTLKAADASKEIKWIGIMGQSYDFSDFETMIRENQITKPVTLIQGGDTRQESVFNGLKALPSEAKKVLIHDGARCLVTAELFDRCAKKLLSCDGLIAGIPVKDTIKVVNSSHFIVDTPKRDDLWAAQTPQGFTVDLLKTCHEKGVKLNWQVTDDAALFEMCNLPVKVVLGEETNLKITTPLDLAIAEFILKQK